MNLKKLFSKEFRRKEKMKKIYILAYTNINLGDDLFIKILCERYPNVQFYLECNSRQAKPFINIKNLEIIYTKKSKVLLRKLINKIPLNIVNPFDSSIKLIDNCDATVNIGGSIFMEHKTWKKTKVNYLNKIRKSNAFFILGSNFGPVESQNYLDAYKEIFHQVNDVCFREEFSYNLFKENEKVRYAPDIVFSVDRNSNLTREQKLSKRYIIISVINLENREGLRKYEQRYIAALTELIIELNEQNYEVVLMSFCEAEGDLEAINKVVKSVGNTSLNSNVRIYNYEGDLNEALKIIELSKGIIATRFHATVLGLIYNKSIYPLIYSNKTLHVLNDLNYSGDILDIKNIDELNIKKVLIQLLDSKVLDIEEQRLKSLNHFLKLDNFLGDK